ncbi:MAG: hypothetical protein ACPG47_01135 [Leucothrix sp.]
MNFKKQSSYKLLLAGITCVTLTACGGSDETVIQPTGLIVDSSNYQSAFRTGVAGTTKLSLKLMFAGNDIDPDDLTLQSSTATSKNYACDNVGGTIEITQLNSDTQEWVFNNCHTTETPTNRYHGTTTMKTVVNSGMAANVGSYLHDWNITQTIALNNFSQTSPITNGENSTANGTIEMTSSNSLTNNRFSTTMTSNDLSFAVVDASSATTNYDFSDMFYSLDEDTTAAEKVTSDIEFVGNISGLGEVSLDTNPALVFDSNGKLESGAGTVKVGQSAGKLVGTGNDGVAISLDPENDGTFEAAISTTWSAIYGTNANTQ